MMSIYKRLAWSLFYSAALLLTTNCSALADPFVTYKVADEGDGFKYNLSVVNPAGNPQFFVSGLIVLNGFSVFQLDATSAIGAPTDWGFLPPLPPFADNLAYFSNVDTADVQPGATLENFTFKSPTNPGDICPCGDFRVVLIDRVKGTLDPINAQPVPESSSILLLGLGLAGLAGRLRLGKSLVKHKLCLTIGRSG
jgi:hypothetical protein